MKREDLIGTAKALLVEKKGILASDSSPGSIERRFAKVGLEATEENRIAFRELFYTTDGLEEFISGVIMHDEIIRANSKSGESFVEILSKKGILPGIKVDMGKVDMPGFPGEMVTEGLDGLRERLTEYKKLGAKFAKWRSVISIGDRTPTTALIKSNNVRLCLYALFCHEAGLVPIVEPEVVMTGSHNSKRCSQITKMVLENLFTQMFDYKVDLSAVILKANMILPGKDSGQKVTSDKVGRQTLDCIRSAASIAIPGIVFLSGGQEAIAATQNLNETARAGAGDTPWTLSFSFERALQEPSLEIWKGKEENVQQAQKVFLHRAKMNSLATIGDYNSKLENGKE